MVAADELRAKCNTLTTEERMYHRARAIALIYGVPIAFFCHDSIVVKKKDWDEALAKAGHTPEEIAEAVKQGLDKLNKYWRQQQ